MTGTGAPRAGRARVALGLVRARLAARRARRRQTDRATARDRAQADRPVDAVTVARLELAAARAASKTEPPPPHLPVKAQVRRRRDSQRIREPKETAAMAEGMTLEEQGEVGRAFLAGLLSEYGVSASVETRLLDDETVEIAAMGEDLGPSGRATRIDAQRSAGPDPGGCPAPMPVADRPHPGGCGRIPGEALCCIEAVQHPDCRRGHRNRAGEGPRGDEPGGSGRLCTTR